MVRVSQGKVHCVTFSLSDQETFSLKSSPKRSVVNRLLLAVQRTFSRQSITQWSLPREKKEEVNTSRVSDTHKPFRFVHRHMDTPTQCVSTHLPLFTFLCQGENRLDRIVTLVRVFDDRKITFFNDGFIVLCGRTFDSLKIRRQKFWTSFFVFQSFVA